MEMAPGALPRPGRAPEQRLYVPRISLLVAAALRRFSWISSVFFRVFGSEASYRRRGGRGGGQRAHTLPRRGPGLASPRGVWPPSGASLSLLLESCPSWKVINFGFCPVQFR